jgi:hypothetical protein
LVGTAMILTGVVAVARTPAPPPKAAPADSAAAMGSA